MPLSATSSLDRVKHLHPHTFRVILSDYTELEPINCGSVYRYYTEPRVNKTLRRNIQEAFRHYEQLHETPDALRRGAVLHRSQ